MTQKSDRDLAIKALMKRSRELRHSHDLWGTILDVEDSEIDADKKYHDSTVILVVTAAVEQVLEQAISSHFVLDESDCRRMFSDEENGPLGALAGKIKMGYALGIYTKTLRDDLNLMRHMRNLVAHAKEALDFSSEEIAAACASLKIQEHHMALISPSPKRRFMNAARMAFLYLEDPEATRPMRFETHPGKIFVE
jgi:DNA-binding MltR family transcriptional regulator